MPAHIKLLRLLGAALVTIALVPWLGVSPAAATGGGAATGSSAARADDAKRDSSAKSQHGRDDTAKAGQASKADTKPDRAGAKPNEIAKSAGKGKSDAKSNGKATSDAAKSDTAKPDDQAESSGNQKVTLCHRTNADSNPYVTITVSINSVIKSSGHDGHQGPVYAAGMKAAKQKWGDIIPAFSYPGGSYAGKNWPAGRAIFDAGCEAPTGGSTTTPPPTSTPSSEGGNQKVTLCHRTNSETNPYVRITVSINSVVKGHGHDGHNGPIFEAGMKSAQQKWGDIIPSFTYPAVGGNTAAYGGKNWPAGQAIFNAGCTVAQPTTTTSLSPTTTTSVSPSTTTSVSPSGTETSDTSVQPTKIGGDDNDTRVLGGRSGVLPQTGLALPIGAALGLSLALLLAGGSLLLAPSRIADRKRRH